MVVLEQEFEECHWQPQTNKKANKDLAKNYKPIDSKVRLENIKKAKEDKIKEFKDALERETSADLREK
jgi:hypothetical protein